MIYLDYNATTPLWPEARDAMVEALDHAWGNPSSVHAAGRAARAVVDEARRAVAELVGATPDEVVFTSGATEALNQVLASVPAGRVVCSALEHPAVFAAIEHLGRHAMTVVAPEPRGPVSVSRVLAAVDDGPLPVLAIVMAANNVTGIENPVADLVGPLRERGVPLLVDAVQLAGKRPVGVRPDYLVVAAHKLGGPKGVGALVVRAGAPLAPLVVGGGQERGLRGGTEPVPALAGFAAAARASIAHRDTEAARLADLRDRAEARLLAALPGSYVIGSEAPRLPNTISFVLPAGIEAEAVVRRLARDGIALSAGSACHAGSPHPSPTLLALGLTPAECFRAVRISLGHATVASDLDALVELLPVAARAVAA